MTNIVLHLFQVRMGEQTTKKYKHNMVTNNAQKMQCVYAAISLLLVDW